MEEFVKFIRKKKEWDNAISLMKDVIALNPNDVDAYIAMNYLLMNLLVEEDYDITKHDYYTFLTKHYFTESYSKFSDNPEYLFFTSFTASMSEWYVGIEFKDIKKMYQKALELEPNNLLYQWNYFNSLDLKNKINKKKATSYAQIVLEWNSPIKKILSEKGLLGECLLEIMINWSKRTLNTRNGFNG